MGSGRYIADWNIAGKVDELHELAMDYGTAVIDWYTDDYLGEFYAFYEIRDKSAALVPYPVDFREALKITCGEYRWEQIAEKTESLFGLPKRILVFDNEKTVTEQLAMGEGGVGPFYFVFDLLFCEYEGFTLCFISGSND